MLNFYPKMMGYSGGGGGGGGSGGGGGGGGAGGGAGGSAGGGTGGAAVGTGVGGLKTNNICGEGGRNAINGSVFFSRETADYLQVGSAGDHNYLHDGTEDYSVEFWIFPTQSNDRQTVFSTGGNSDSTGFACRIMEDGASGGSNGTKVLCQFSRGADGNYLGFLGGTVDINSWSHVALQFTTSNKQLKIYVNGQLTNSSDLDGTANGTFGSGNFSSSNSTYAFTIGREPYGNTLYLDGGFISNLRICRGHIIYSSNFTPPTSPLTAHFSNSTDKTTILCCQNSDNPLEENSVSISGESIPQTITGYGRFPSEPYDANGEGPELVTSTGVWTLEKGGGGATDFSVTNNGQTLTGTTVTSGYIRANFTGLNAGSRYRVKATVVAGSNNNIGIQDEHGYQPATDGTAGTALQVGPTYVFEFGGTTTVRITGSAWNVQYIFDDVSIKQIPSPDAPKINPPFGTDDGVTFDGAIAMNSSAYMYFPTGRTEERGGSRGILAGGFTPSEVKTIDFFNLQSTGNALAFGNLTDTFGYVSGYASRTRAVFSCNYNDPAILNTLEFITIVTQGNSIDFGDRTVTAYENAALSNETRGLVGGGYDGSGSGAPNNTETIDFNTIASLGNSTDFGDLTLGRRGLCGLASPTRGVFAAGYQQPSTSTKTNVIDFVTIASAGNASNFGDLVSQRWGVSPASSTTRGVFAGGTNPSDTDSMEFITIASTGDTTDFGDLTQNSGRGAGTSDSIRGVFKIGYTPSTGQNTLEFVTIATTGNAADFGDSISKVHSAGMTSNAHGGLS